MGNPTSYLGKTLAWEGKKLVAYTDGGNTISYAYNEDGLRLEKTVNGVNTEYYYNGSILIAMADGTNTQKFSYDSTGNVVSVNFNGTEYYYFRNAQGDIVKLIDKNKNAVVEYTYDSWGKPVAVTGTLATTLGANQPFRYRGYAYDNETGWYYLQSRYYDPTTCRFISADVLLSTGQGVIGHNSFAYCGNNSAGRIDSEGTFWEEIGEFFQQLGEAFQNTMNALAPQQQWCTEIGMMDGPYPVADAIGLVGLAGIAIYAFGKAIYQTATAPAISMPMTQSPAITVPKVEEKPDSISLPVAPKPPVIFPVVPLTFSPIGLIRNIHAGTKNGQVITWNDPITKAAIFRWDENPNYPDGPHYHVLGFPGKHFIPGVDCVPEPYATLYFQLY